LDEAFNYARWLTKSDADAEDVVQDAAVRALRYFSSLRNEPSCATRGPRTSRRLAAPNNARSSST
jgi:DNA-directed RNA polymerase specialized sigma24 family protein